MIQLKAGTYTFQIKDKIGEGSFGKVFRGRDTENNKLVAIKQIKISLLKKNGEEFQSLLCEISIMQNVAQIMKEKPCPYLVQYVDCLRSEENIYIITEYCEKGNLLQVLQKQKITEASVINIIHSILLGLNYLHSVNITHRDLKLQNIFVSGSLYKIGDYGFASQQKTFQDMIGTIFYMAPEIIKGEQYNNKVDVWSLGIMAYQLLFNELYFQGKDRWQTQTNIKTKPFQFTFSQRKCITIQMARFIEACLIKEPITRPTVKQLLQSPLFSVKKQQQIKINQQCPFQRIDYLLFWCCCLKEGTQLFQQFSKNHKRATIFIQTYLLKKAFCSINRLTYTLLHKQNHIDLSEHQMQVMILQQNKIKHCQASKKIEDERNQITNLFNRKYQQLHLLIQKQFQDLKQSISSIVNDSPYDDPNPKIIKLELQKWMEAFKVLKEYKLQLFCARVLENFYQQMS